VNFPCLGAIAPKSVKDALEGGFRLSADF